MGCARLIHEAEGDGDLGLDLVVQFVDAPLPEKGLAGDGERNGIGDAGLTQAVAAGNDGLGTESKHSGCLIALEAVDGHTGDLKSFDFFHVVLLHAA